MFQHGDTALHIATRTEDKEFYEILLKCGASQFVANKVCVLSIYIHLEVLYIIMLNK